MPDIGNPDDSYRKLVREAGERGSAVYKVSADDTFHLGEIYVRCLNPERGACFEDKNTYSCVLELKYKDFSALLTGDVQDEGEETAIRKLAGRYNVLQAAHHGSKYSTPVEFLEIVQPELVIISAGKNNRYGHPHEETLERLKAYTDRVYVTKDTGEIDIKTDGKTVKLSTYSSAVP